MNETKWIDIVASDDTTLPPFDECVALHILLAGSVVTLLGCRVDDPDGWLWARECGTSEWRHNERWECGDPEEDDLVPIRWRSLWPAVESHAPHDCGGVCLRCNPLTAGVRDGSLYNAG